MPNKKDEYYVGDDITLRGIFQKNGINQTPDEGTALIEIWKKGSASAFLTSTAATISGNEINYKVSNITVGQYAAFITAKLDSGADERTGVIEFIVKKKGAY